MLDDGNSTVVASALNSLIEISELTQHDYVKLSKDRGKEPVLQYDCKFLKSRST